MADIVRLHRVARAANYQAQARRRVKFGVMMLAAGAFLAVAALGAYALPFVMPYLPSLTRSAKGPDIVFVTLPMCKAG